MRQAQIAPYNGSPFIVGNELVSPPIRHRAVTLLIGLCIVVIAAICLTTAMLVSDFRNRAFADSERELKNTAMILAQQIAGSLQALDVVESSIIDDIELARIEAVQGFDEEMGRPEVYATLKDKIRALPQVDALILVNSRGDVTNFSRQWPIPRLNVSDRTYFKTLAANPQLTSFVSEPIRSRTTGEMTLYLARRLPVRNGKQLGFVVGSIQLAYFERTFAGIALGHSSVISLARDDGVLLARFPPNSITVGQTLPRVTERLKDRDSATVRLISRGDAMDRLLALQRVPQFPLFVSVAASVDTILSDWRTQSRLFIGVGFISALSIGGVVLLIAREVIKGLRAAHRLLSRQKLQLDSALLNMSQGLLMTDSDGRVLLCNNRYLEIYNVQPEFIIRGCTRGDLLKYKCATGVLSEEHLKNPPGDIDRQQALGSRTVRTSDGRVILVIDRASEGGMYVSTHEDITERHRAEEERDRNRAFLDRVIQNIPVAIVVKSAPDFRCMLMNRAAELLWGVTQQEAAGKTADEVFPAPIADMIIEYDRKLLQHTEVVLSLDEHELQTPKNGTRTVTSKRLCMRAENGDPQYIISVIEDITERKNLGRQLLQAQKMEAVGNLTGGVAHDFNNLLTIIIGNLELLQEDIAGNEAARDKVETILDASARGSQLARQLLAFGRRQPLHAKPVDVNKLAEETVRLLRRTLGESVSLDFKITPELWTAFVDATQLEAAIVNIAINARDAMAHGGTLTIETRNATLGRSYAECHPGAAVGDYVLLEITDTGVGISPELMDRIFEPFFTTKVAERGTGLGLSMVYGFIKQSGGHVSVYSDLGHGTTFKLYLPVARTSTAAPHPARIEAEPPKRDESGAIILAVDDNEAVRSTAVKQLKRLGYTVHEADSAHAAWKILNQGAKIDVLFTDIVMPGGIDGKELATAA